MLAFILLCLGSLRPARAMKEPPARPPVETKLWMWNPAGEVVAPILLYHHIARTDKPQRYVVSPENFAIQMQALRDWGYIPVRLSTLIHALEYGDYLPLRPVVISFDDGYQDVYIQALPIMQRLNYPGITYVIVNTLNQQGYLHTNDLKVMLNAGWEIGDHSETHADLRWTGEKIRKEVYVSRLALQALLDTSVTSFSFPYGFTTPYAMKYVKDSGFQSAVGVGGRSVHRPTTQYYLSRIEVDGRADLQAFADLLPWSAPLNRKDLFGNLEP